MRAAGQRPFNTAMLVAQGDLQVKDRFTVTLEAEMPRFDDTGMYRSDRYFMNLVPLNLVKFSHARQDDVVYCSSPGVMSTAAGALVADRLEPWVAVYAYAALLGDLAFEQMCLGADGSYAGQALFNPRP
jgi:hypothetical protein